MSGSLGQLTSRQLERLKSELAEVIIANFCYPAFLDYRLNLLRTRPVDRRKRQEVWAYVNGLNFSPLNAMDASSVEFRRFVERVFLRASEMNRALLVTTSARQIAAARARVPQLAAQVARSLAEYLALGEASSFGRARPIESWGASAQGASEPTWEQIEKSTQLLQTTLVYLRANSAESAGQPTPAEGRTTLDQKYLVDISDFPTKLLSSRPDERQSAPVEAANGATSSPANTMLGSTIGNGVGKGQEDSKSLSHLPGEQGPVAPRQFMGPGRSHTASRPIDTPLAPSARAPGGSSPMEAIQPPSLSRPPAPEPKPEKVPLPEPPVPPSPDAWQALLLPESQEQMSGPSAQDSTPTPFALPDADLLDLPESFGTQRLLDLPPDLAELYGDYLRDAHAASFDSMVAPTQGAEAGIASGAAPAAPAPVSSSDEEVDALFNALTQHIAESDDLRTDSAPSRPLSPSGRGILAPASSSGSLSTSRPAGNSPQSVAPAKAVTDADVMIFSQLQHQIFTWLKMAAVSHQIDIASRDAAELLAELRRVAALDEAELQVLESLVAICLRVATAKCATLDDYKQAMMLYLLHHRSRLAL